ncbi:integrase [Streptomyces sp. NBC_01410]|uniref:integrase n=1 Tax=Streptomyces sp. NBC_01410 TaxID=2903856 RepID=UPI003248B206
MHRPYASLLIHAGESVKVVAERLGHTNAVMTLNVYSRFPDSAEHTRRAVDDAFAAALPSSALDVPSDLPGRQ